MQHLSRSVQVKASASQAFQLVNHIDGYKDFLPWCTGSRVLSSGKSWAHAELIVRFGVTRINFRTRNTWQPPHRLELKQTSGPFSEFQGLWQFTDIADNLCQITLDIEFKFKPLLRWLARKQLVEQTADEVLKAFCKRIQQSAMTP